MYQFNPTITVIAGMATVFAVLTIMVIVIWFSRHLFGAKDPEFPASEPDARSQPAPALASADQQLVAVITAAVSAARGASSPPFRIAAIEPSSGGFTTPVWGHVNRLFGQQRRS
ncbi:MAG: OadG family protein [Spirochaetes bacterium]|nr:OadG family protein [Spirochaetota bacterium]